MPLLVATFILGGSFTVSAIKNIQMVEPVQDTESLKNQDGLVYVKEGLDQTGKDYLEEVREALLSATKQTGDKNALDSQDKTAIKQFSLDEIKTVAENPETLQEYGLNISKIFKNYSDPEKKSLIETVVTLHQEKDGDPTIVMENENGQLTAKVEIVDFTKLRSVLISAEERAVVAIGELSQIDVPESLAENHIKLLNNLLLSAFYIANMQTMTESPEIGLVATEEYALKMYDIASNLGLINEYLINKKVVFTNEQKSEIFLDLI